MRRYVFVIALCLGVAILTGASPIADLLSRVEALEGTVVALETENQELSEQVTALKGESDNQPVVVDANGVQVGIGLHGVYSKVAGLSDERKVGPFALFDIEGFPAFGVEIHEGGLESPNSGLGYVYFEGGCISGRPLFWKGSFQIGEVMPNVFVHRSRADVPIYIEGAPIERPAAEYLARLSETGACDGIQRPNYGLYFEALDTEIYWPRDFAAPFEVVTRGDLLAD